MAYNDTINTLAKDPSIMAYNDTINTLAKEDPEKYYNNMADNYEETVRDWGYNMPQVVANTLERFLLDDGVDVPSVKVLDLGCGDGLVGVELYKRSITKITGADISANMLAKANQRGVYSAILKRDLNEPLSLPEDRWDVITCVGTTTYLNPEILADWLKAVRVGGLIVFTTKKSFVEVWEKQSVELQESGKWEKVWISDPLPYLPNLRSFELEFAKIYVYRKI